MKHNMIVAFATVIIVAVAGTACAVSFDNSNSGTDGNTDFAGYEIKPVENLDKGIVAVGQDSFRWVTYFGLANKCVMVDMNDKTNYMGKSFMYVGKAQALNANNDLKYTSTNCGITADDVRTIINLNPSIVIVPADFESTLPQEMKALRSANLNIYHITNVYQFLTEDGTFELTEEMTKQIDGLGKVLGKSDRAESLKKVIRDTVADILSIRENITERRTGYIGSIAYGGAHGVDSSMSYYLPFELAGVENIIKDVNADADKISHVATYSATSIKEHIKEDTILFLDATGIYTFVGKDGKYLSNSNTDQGIIKLFEGHDAYLACPYIWTGLNIENVLVGAYQILHDAYESLSDDEFKQKIDAAYDGFLGSADSIRKEPASGVPVSEGLTVYEDMSHVYEQRRGNKISGKISFDANGIKYSP